MASQEVGLVIHIFGALLFFGGALVAGVLFETAKRRSRPSEIALLLGVTRVGALILAVGGVVVLGAGLWLAADAERFGEPWLLASLGLFAAAVGLGALGGRRPKQARRLAVELAAGRDEMTTELRRLLDDPLSQVVNYGSSALVAVILVLMVWQPGA